jgi:hypothetical protein
VLIESALFTIGILIYLHETEPIDRIGSFGMLGFIFFLALAYVANSKMLPPTNERALAWFAMLSWLLPIWAWWFDRHRKLARE